MSTQTISRPSPTTDEPNIESVDAPAQRPRRRRFASTINLPAPADGPPNGAVAG